MGKRIEIDGKFYRMRRGKLVEIPEEWVGKDQWKQSIRKRKSMKAWRKGKGRSAVFQSKNTLTDEEAKSHAKQCAGCELCVEPTFLVEEEVKVDE
jgi:hypothetical protein